MTKRAELVIERLIGLGWSIDDDDDGVMRRCLCGFKTSSKSYQYCPTCAEPLPKLKPGSSIKEVEDALEYADEKLKEQASRQRVYYTY